MNRPFTCGNVRKVSNFGRWECVITSPAGNVGKAYGDDKKAVAECGAMFAEAPAMVDMLRAFYAVTVDDKSAAVKLARESARAILRRVEGQK